MKNLKKESSSGISYVEIPSELAQPLGDIVLLHGYGASAHDLLGLVEWIDPDRLWRWLFPQGPITLSFGLGQHGYAWFPIDLLHMSQAYLRKDYGVIACEDPSELRQARKLLSIFLGQVSASQRLVLGGFSQGGMVAVDTFFEGFSTLNIRALMLFSTSIVASPRWQQKKGLAPKIPVFLSHGQSDLVLPFLQAEQLQSFFTGPVNFQAFPGGHEIPGQILRAAQTFLASCFQEQENSL